MNDQKEYPPTPPSPPRQPPAYCVGSHKGKVGTWRTTCGDDGQVVSEEFKPVGGGEWQEVRRGRWMRVLFG